MESIGEKLRQAREEKGYTLEQVARETHIAKRFLSAMEEEDFDIFPGEPYLLGFLRTYTEFLELDSQEMVALYKNLKIQEQPAPMDELLVSKRSPKPYIVSGAIAVGVAVLGVVVFLLINSGVFAGAEPGPVSGQDGESAAAQNAGQGETLTLSEEVLEQPFAEGDVVTVPVGDEEFPIVFAGIDDVVTVTTPSGAQSVAPEEEAILDLNADGRGDLRFLVRQIGTERSDSSAVVRLDRAVQSPSVASNSAEDTGTQEETTTETIGSTTEPTRERSARVIVERNSPGSFDVRFTFQGPSLLLHQSDGGAREQEVLENGDSFQTSAEESLRMWVTNAGAARAEIAGQAVSLGNPGQVTANLVRWVEDQDSGQYRLELIPMY
jgi:cytoskeletal protein RodZ